jgi:hypothetical protein
MAAHTHSDQPRRRVHACVAAVSLVLAACGLAACGEAAPTSSRDGCDEQAFDARAWRAWPDPTVTSRQDLTDEILACRYFVGDTRAQMLRTLGAPQQRPGGERRWRWEIGGDRVVGFHTEYLEVRFDARGSARRLVAIRG